MDASGEVGVGLVERRFVTFDEPLSLEGGRRLEGATLAYETYGRPGAENAILVLHALSGDAHAAGRHTIDDRRPGWWDVMIGPGKPFDTDRYFVICSNVIGGCQGSTGPTSLNPATGRAYGPDFPVITIGDMVNAQVRLVEYLGIDRLHCVTGGSMGGFQALEWATAHPRRVRSAILMGTSARSSAQTIAWNSIGRHAIMADPRWNGGWYTDRPEDGLAVARMIGHITYLCDQKLEEKFGRAGTPAFNLGPEFEIESYLRHKGATFNQRFDANSYLYITKAMDYWDLPGRYGSLEAAFARTEAAFLILSYSSDWLYPTAESAMMAAALRSAGKSVVHHELHTSAGHDAFLVDTGQQAEIVADFLANLTRT